MHVNPKTWKLLMFDWVMIIKSPGVSFSPAENYLKSDVLKLDNVKET